MMNQAWEHAFQELWSQAAQHRGLQEAMGDVFGPAFSETRLFAAATELITPAEEAA